MTKQSLSQSIFSLTLIMMICFPGISLANENSEMKDFPMEQKGSMAEHKESDMDPAMVAMMAKWQKYSTPSEGHTILNALVGSWSYTMRHWMSADAPAEESTGSSESAWVLDGRFVEETVNGASMGEPFSGKSILGYNNGTGLYSSYWIDNMSTGAMFDEGSYDSQTKKISSSGEFYCPMREGDTAYRSVLTITDENSHTYEFYMTETDGKEFLAMTIEYRRK